MAINLKDLTKTIIKEQSNNKVEFETVYGKDIAIIGISCRFASAENIDEYWNILVNGRDCIRTFPENRKKVNEVFLKTIGNALKDDGYFQGGFLQEIDKFDFELFNISLLEASLMSPSQRVFLETAWSAIEDAGYGGKKIAGSNTGVYLGHSTDFGVTYKEYIEKLNPSLASFAISGNLNSLIASRISYMLDLKGPSMLVDTACSSSLVAVHMACFSLRNRECSMALAGAVKIDLLPLNSIKKKEDEIGITSPDGRARAFDDSSEGTGLGEGVAAILLKPLSRAVEDGDHIYAIIKGSAANQDGSSVNLTSPNPAAQEEVIIKAWQNAGISPETITYIEAHGTGTELGDPIEIKGIEKAFKRYTNRKQFCAIGSVKTNIGHLDNAAGMAGLIKVVLALKNKMIPPSIHFRNPNRKINFEDTPVYVNDILREWKTGQVPGRCGVSAFGLSGTNCHVVLEEAPDVKINNGEILKNKTRILALSAKNREGIQELVWQYQLLLYKEKSIDLDSVCYTANTGRGHYGCRLAITFDDIEELLIKLEKSAVLEGTELLRHGVFYGEHKIVSEKQKTRGIGEITQSQKVDNTNQANKKLYECLKESKDINREVLDELCKMYVSGSDIEWELLYRGNGNKKVSLPVYPFLRKTCWIEASTELVEENHPKHKEIDHPLFERCLADSFEQIIYLSVFDVNKYWILNEHKVAGNFVVPGTTYLEMVTEILSRHYAGWTFQLKDVVFVSPLALNNGEEVEVHSAIKNQHDGLEFTIASKPIGGTYWRTHVEGKVVLFVNKNESSLDIESIKGTHKEGTVEHYGYEPGKGIETGPRWDCIKETYVGKDGIMAYLCLNEEYWDELNQYNLHPALLDEAVNIALRSVDKGLYLPFSYKSMIIIGRLTGRIYSYVKRKNTDRVKKEFASFDITLTDDTGNKIVYIEDYIIKKVDISSIEFGNSKNNVSFSQILWKEKQNGFIGKANDEKSVIMFKGEGDISDNIVKAVKKISGKVVEVGLGTGFEAISDENFTSRPEEYDYFKVFKYINLSNTGKIVYLHTLSGKKEIRTFNDLEEEQSKGIYGFFNLVKALVKNRLDKDIELIIIAQYANGVSNQQKSRIPENSALFGLGKALSLEYPKIKCRCIDIDDYTHADIIVSELNSEYRNYLTAYRYGQRFIPYIDPIDINKTQGYKFEIKEKGVYVITGGTGGIGLEVAKFLSSKAHVNIAIINRSTFPSVEKWSGIMERGEDIKLCNKISILTEIKQNGSNIALYNSDVSDMERMKEVFNDIKTKFGRINGVFHIAGNAGDGFIIKKDKNAFRNVIAPKIEGTWIIDKLTQGESLDCFVMFSSISTIAVEAGQADYAAANSYLDAYSYYGSRKGARCITINWPAWTETGMAVDYGVDLAKEVFSPISTRKAIEVLNTILGKDIHNVIVGDVNYSNYLSSKSDIFDLSPKLIAKIANKNKFSQIKMHNSKGINSGVFNMALIGAKDKDHYTMSERRVAGIIGNVLGLREVNIYDGFLELGGNSIIAVKVEMEMEKNGIPISIVDLYEYKTIKELAEFLDNKLGKTVATNKKPLEDFEVIPTIREAEEFESDNNLKPTGNLLLENIKPFNEVFYKTCFHNSLFPVLKHFDISLVPILANDIFVYSSPNEGEVLYDSGMANIADKTLYELLNDLGVTMNTQNHVCAMARDIIPPNEDISLLKQFSQYIGIKPKKEKKSTTDLLRDIKEALTNRRPVIIWVDCFYESIRNDTYNKEHWMHTLLIYGFDENKEVFFAIEHNFKENLTYKEQEISFKDILASYEGFIANYMDYIDMPAYYEFFLRDNNGNGNETNITNYNYIFQEMMFIKKGKITTGLENLKILVDKVCKILIDEHKLESNIDSLIAVLNSIINAKQLEKYNISNLFIGKINIIGDIENVINMWAYIRQILVKYKYSSIYDSKKVMVVVERLHKVYQLECKYYNKLFALRNV